MLVNTCNSALSRLRQENCPSLRSAWATEQDYFNKKQKKSSVLVSRVSGGRWAHVSLTLTRGVTVHPPLPLIDTHAALWDRTKEGVSTMGTSA